jgi:uncharacterized protein YdeI (YjbR/CyaY-like superfamily)
MAAKGSVVPTTSDLLRASSRQAWRAWLERHHEHATEAWLVLHKAAHRGDRLSLSDAVEEALCFGWIDGKLKPLDATSYALRFTPRRSGSVWSVTNISRVRRLTRQGKMKPAGLAKVAEARRNGQWHAAQARERTDQPPPDLRAALRRRKGATAGFRRLPESRKKQLLHLLATARKSETREKRIANIVAEAAGAFAL